MATRLSVLALIMQVAQPETYDFRRSSASGKTCTGFGHTSLKDIRETQLNRIYLDACNPEFVILSADKREKRPTIMVHRPQKGAERIKSQFSIKVGK